jgi:branched-subunit amino acid transport protein
VSWWAVLALCGCAYALKAVGLAVGGRVRQGDELGGSLELVVVPVLAALIVVQTVGGDREMVLDARLPAVLVAAVLVWRRAPILVIVLAAGATAALLRLIA